jgi:hypothetical protein
MPSEPDSLAPSFSFCSCFWFYCLSMFENLLGRFDQEIVPKGTDNHVWAFNVMQQRGPGPFETGGREAIGIGMGLTAGERTREGTSVGFDDLGNLIKTRLGGPSAVPFPGLPLPRSIFLWMVGIDGGGISCIILLWFEILSCR